MTDDLLERNPVHALDPVVATPGGITVLDARVRLLPRHSQDTYLRRLR
ncbi:hypothetical protein AB0F46_37175 [Streptomyces sp. NPDC026665]